MMVRCSIVKTNVIIRVGAGIHVCSNIDIYDKCVYIFICVCVCVHMNTWKNSVTDSSLVLSSPLSATHLCGRGGA